MSRLEISKNLGHRESRVLLRLDVVGFSDEKNASLALDLPTLTLVKEGHDKASKNFQNRVEELSAGILFLRAEVTDVLTAMIARNHTASDDAIRNLEQHGLHLLGQYIEQATNNVEPQIAPDPSLESPDPVAEENVAEGNLVAMDSDPKFDDASSETDE
ncbi:MAG: hypothetical protein M1819_000937 [Sarea resinae]|nr:MAG: hypothetical protein M1819_000937 [Sarea resinae]